MIFKCIICIYHGHYLIFSLCYCGRNVSPHCHMFTCIKGGGDYPAHTEKYSVTMSNTFAASAVTATQYPLPVLPLALAMLFPFNRAKLRSHCTDNATIATNQHCFYSTHAVASRSPLFLALEQVLLLHLPTHP